MNLLVTIDSDEHAKSLIDKIKLLEHVTHVEEEENVVDAELHEMLEERMNDYRRNPTDVVSWEELKANIQKKHGY